MSEKKLQKAADDSQNEENTNDNTGFIVVGFLSGSRNKQVIPDSQ